MTPSPASGDRRLPNHTFDEPESQTPVGAIQEIDLAELAPGRRAPRGRRTHRGDQGNTTRFGAGSVHLEAPEDEPVGF